MHTTAGLGTGQASRPGLACFATSTIFAILEPRTFRHPSTQPKVAMAVHTFDIQDKYPPEIYSQAEAGWKLVGSEARNFGVAAMLDIGRISVRGSIEAHSSIYRRHQRSARTKPALYVWYWSIGRANSGWRWRTVLADSDGLAIAPQDTIHLPDHGTSPNACSMRSLKSWQCVLCSAVPLRSCATILRLRSSSSLQYMRPAFCICPSNVTRHGV